MDSSVHLDNVVMRFGDFTAVTRTDLKIESGEFFSFLGPSGCGKTTLLNMVSGFLQPTEGCVRIGGMDMTHVPANKRPTSMIFQNLALFPLMTVAENIEFGLEVRGIKRGERKKVSDRLLNLVALPESANKKVSELSGGQKQRIAIARALAIEPQVLLLDEPLSALDLKLRQHMRTELKDIQRKTGITFIYITHDQGEALTMSDRVGVMSAGKLQQVGDPMRLYRKPETQFCASFVGENNKLTGTVSHVDGHLATVDCGSAGHLQGTIAKPVSVGENVCLFIRPEFLRRHKGGETGANQISLRLNELNFEGSYIMADGQLANTEQNIRVQLNTDSYLDDLTPGSNITFGYQPQEATVIGGEHV
ncbi:ABC transporter ATP-binding protein [Pokkaliibacter sp. CJK22405]|uniref:ABC transporter ATP-binding protein n=1 Tax=Pokkaliibacter sp. CJK22405 TaxID=3384615 RepID=UPI0039855DA2